MVHAFPSQRMKTLQLADEHVAKTTSMKTEQAWNSLHPVADDHDS
jgi:hypothetical protein